ncbi:ribosomal L28e protein family-domain-containing protein [Mycena alexandri]|uniref:Ribosomal L28e protein family-domain-containing protein n=1 Tax=Mycena alexandri TaxID=1745969 RepID=A0AAD6XEQ2_9AGAR|nr:ribosomal L28e protein family-domain-containing protein [Mycena alexandri]
MSTDLQWLLIRKNNSFIVKRGADVGQVFSKENGNLRNLHSQKFSGLANTKTVHVTESGSGIQIISRKQKATPGAVSRATSTDTIRARTGGRRALGIAAATTSKKAGRPDLRTAALARVSALLASHNEPRSIPPKKKSRSKKTAAPAAVARKSKAAAADDDDDDLPDLV